MKEIILKIKNISNQEDYFGKSNIINVSIILLCFLVSLLGDIDSAIFSHIFILMWVSSASCQLFNLHERKRSDFIWGISDFSTNRIIIIIFCVAILQNIMFLPVIIIYLMLFFKATIIIATLTGIIHFFFAIAIGASLNVFFRSRYGGLIANIVLFLFYFTNGIRWTSAELYRIVSPVVQLYNVDMVDTTNVLGLISIIILACSIVWIKNSFSINKISIYKIYGFMISISLVLLVGYYEEYRNQKVFSSDYKSIRVDDISVSYRGLDEEHVKRYAEMVIDIDKELYTSGSTSNRINQLSIQKYTAPIYLKARRIPFSIEGETMNINIFSNAMLNTKDVDLMMDMFYRISTQIILHEDADLLGKKETYGLIYQAIYKVIKDNVEYSQELKSHAKKMVELTAFN